ncbi:MAG: hypothetical protein QG641_204, partial [Candidatus Poribacteria bacterium]|nr:hypothetical protein [Candidatus Poribacteria bacterium]
RIQNGDEIEKLILSLEDLNIENWLK